MLSVQKGQFKSAAFNIDVVNTKCLWEVNTLMNVATLVQSETQTINQSPTSLSSPQRLSYTRILKSLLRWISFTLIFYQASPLLKREVYTPLLLIGLFYQNWWNFVPAWGQVMDLTSKIRCSVCDTEVPSHCKPQTCFKKQTIPKEKLVQALEEAK